MYRLVANPGNRDDNAFINAAVHLVKPDLRQRLLGVYRRYAILFTRTDEQCKKQRRRRKLQIADVVSPHFLTLKQLPKLRFITRYPADLYSRTARPSG